MRAKFEKKKQDHGSNDDIKKNKNLIKRLKIKTLRA